MSLSNVDGDEVCHLGEVLAKAAELPQVGHERGSGARAKVDHKRTSCFGEREEGRLGLAGQVHQI